MTLIELVLYGQYGLVLNDTIECRFCNVLTAENGVTTFDAPNMSVHFTAPIRALRTVKANTAYLLNTRDWN